MTLDQFVKGVKSAQSMDASLRAYSQQTAPQLKTLDFILARVPKKRRAQVEKDLKDNPRKAIAVADKIKGLYQRKYRKELFTNADKYVKSLDDALLEEGILEIEPLVEHDASETHKLAYDINKSLQNMNDDPRAAANVEKYAKKYLDLASKKSAEEAARETLGELEQEFADTKDDKEDKDAIEFVAGVVGNIFGEETLGELVKKFEKNPAVVAAQYRDFVLQEFYDSFPEDKKQRSNQVAKYARANILEAIKNPKKIDGVVDYIPDFTK